MRKTRGYVLSAWWAVVLVGIICHTPTARAGWGGLINGAGYGNSWANTATNSHPLTKSTPSNYYSPSAAIPLTAGYAYTGSNPYTWATTHSLIKGLPGGVWSANTAFAPGNSSDNPELDARVTVVPVTCGSLTMDTSIDLNEFNANGNSGKISVIAHATGGTALWLRGFEYTNSLNDIPADNPDTVANESIEYLKINGKWKFETLLLGPFDFGASCPLIVPFTLDSSNLDNLIFAVDGTGKSVPFSIECPQDITASCGQSVHYPPIHVSGGCGNTTLSVIPPDGSVFLINKTTTVTATATDEEFNTVSCSFSVTVTDHQKPVPPPLPDIVSAGCSGGAVTPLTPVATDNCGTGSVLGTTTTPFPITTPGTNIVTWTFDDGNGNVATATQRVIINSLTFLGFYSPINGIGGGCAPNQVVETINSGSKNPIKFDIKCGNNLITTGTPPTVSIQNWTGCPSPTDPPPDIINVNAVYQNDWHYNWDTSGWAKGIYKIIVGLPDGTSKFVFVKIK